jgi:long-subunit acyl-CoA synthetase (AMP-forming)
VDDGDAGSLPVNAAAHPTSSDIVRARQACSRLSAYCVPLYDSLGENAVEYIITHSEATVVFAASAKLAAFVKSIEGVKEQLKTLVYWGEGSDAVTAAAQVLTSLHPHALPLQGPRQIRADSNSC